MNGNFIKTTRNSQLADFILRKRPTAFALLYLIAKRAKRTYDHPDKSLEIGEAEIGDYEAYGVTEQIYRTDKAWLETNGLITTKPTNKGTIAKLVNKEIFDINEEKVTTKTTQNQRATNEQLTTNKNDKNVKNDKNKRESVIPYSNIDSLGEVEFEEIAKRYNCPVAFVRSEYEDMVYWKESKPNNPKLRGRNWKMTLMAWVKRDSLKIKKDYAKQTSDLAL